MSVSECASEAKHLLYINTNSFDLTTELHSHDTRTSSRDLRGRLRYDVGAGYFITTCVCSNVNIMVSTGCLKPSLKNLTSPDYARPPTKQNEVYNIHFNIYDDCTFYFKTEMFMLFHSFYKL